MCVFVCVHKLKYIALKKEEGKPPNVYRLAVISIVIGMTGYSVESTGLHLFKYRKNELMKV